MTQWIVRENAEISFVHGSFQQIFLIYKMVYN